MHILILPSDIWAKKCALHTAKYSVCTAHAQEVRGDCRREGGYQAEGLKGEKLGQM